MEPKSNKATGSIKISEEVVATIVKTVLSEIEGVHSLAIKPLTASDMVLKSASLKPITIYLNDEVAVISISVNLCFGFKLRTIAEQIQEKVKDSVQDMTGVTVSKVNVYIAGVKSKEQA
ncbi:MAG: Asp23/Gls24 family envelope stress response protein [Oscillospiraceae bacterium]